MNSNKLFTNSQYGFRTNHSTEHAAVEFVDRVAQKLDEGEIPLSIFIDLSKAFDTLNQTSYYTSCSTMVYQVHHSSGLKAI